MLPAASGTAFIPFYSMQFRMQRMYLTMGISLEKAWRQTIVLVSEIRVEGFQNAAEAHTPLKLAGVDCSRVCKPHTASNWYELETLR
jgi:hypothetical protein